MGVLNSAAMQALGVTRDSEAPEGGVIGRKPDGTPNGYLEEAAFTQLSARMPRPARSRPRRASSPPSASTLKTASQRCRTA